MKYPLALFAIAFSGVLSAQDSASQHSFLKPYSFEISEGMSMHHDLPLSMMDMRFIAPSSEFLTRDFSGFPQQGFFSGYTVNGSSNFCASASFKPYCKKQNKELGFTVIRAGFYYSNIEVTGPSFYKQDSQPIDTLYPGNGSTVYDDSVSSENYSFSWTGKFIGLDLSQIFHTNDQRIFSFWAGYGIRAGVVMNTAFQGNYEKIKYVRTTTVQPSSNGGGGGSNISGETFDVKNETIKTASIFSGGIYFPLGMQVRLSRKNNFWNKIAITTEFKSSLDFQPLPNDRGIARFYVSQNLGVKYYFENNASK